MLHKPAMSFMYRARVYGKIPEFHIRKFAAYHVQYKIAVAQMMVKGDGHTVAQAAELYGFPQTRD
jgi:hypothetical protein